MPSSSSLSTSSASTTTSSLATSKPAIHHLESILNTSTSSSPSLLSSITASSTPSLSTTPLSSQRQPSSSSSNTDRPVSPKPMPTPTTLSEWQLLAVLSKANLVQYYDVFIAQGGDDINQIMACEEREFLEIMNLVGMLSKPLHVRRMQRALTEYSQDRTAFNLAALQQIGPPPPLNYTPPGTDPMALLLPGIAAATSPNFPSLRFLSQLSSAASSATEKGTTSSEAADTSSSSPSLNLNTSSNSVPLALKFPNILLESLATDQQQSRPSIATSSSSNPSNTELTSGITTVPSSRATANISSGNSIGLNFSSSSIARHIVPSSSSGTSTPTFPSSSFGRPPISSQEKEGSSSPFLTGFTSPYGNDFVSLGDFDPNNPSQTDSPVLSPAQIARLAECALAASKNLPPLPPRLVQNKKRVSKEVIELLKCTPATPSLINSFRKYSAIYGRFDTKRKPHKVLTLHETTVNEAAAQLCLLVPSLLTRRDELFPLARQIVKDAGYNYAKSRKRPCDPADLHSPISSPSNSPPPNDSEFDEQPSSSSNVFKEDDKAIPPEAWAALIEKMKDEIPESL
ncbi:CRE-MAB-10 protein [Caenorhabditis remanei]|uniref:CRE-MAB-10 protein n=1 Tax=Caenorhabditis remanei TaxID=31234 RepID=E3LFR1_CAERE|nr:CRE-MAB-10 protein [Caenorhabditis remanei]